LYSKRVTIAGGTRVACPFYFFLLVDQRDETSDRHQPRDEHPSHGIPPRAKAIPIGRLYPPSQGWSQRRIAAELDINRETVARYLKRAKSASKPANAPTGSDTLESASNPANAPTGSENVLTGPNLSD
jgi:IS30 family transposase